MAKTNSAVTAAASTIRFSLRKHTGPRPNDVEHEDKPDDELDGAVAESEKANAGQTSTRNASSVLPLENDTLKTDDGTTLRVNDHVYLDCEQRGPPYGLARIMEFLHGHGQPHQPPLIDSIRVNWYYRPPDIDHKVTDTHMVFATMHSDKRPLTSLRGKCCILHASEIDNLDKYRKAKDCFWYEMLFYRFTCQEYVVVPVSNVRNVPTNVKKVLNERWKFVVVEVSQVKELTSAMKSCKHCEAYCASQVPGRKLQTRNTPRISERLEPEEEEDDGVGRDNDSLSADGLGNKDGSIRPATAEQLAHAKLWPYRYLGKHGKVEDALEYDDRIYPRQCSRLGRRYQATVKRNAAIKKSYGSRKRVKVDEPPGYVHRGQDKDSAHPDITARLLFKLPDTGEDSSKSSLLPSSSEEREKTLDTYISQVRGLACGIGVQPHSTDLLDKALAILCQNKYNVEASLNDVRKLDKREDLKQPDLNTEEQKRFEDGVSKFGSELNSIREHVRTVDLAAIVKHYYMCKGRQISGDRKGRRGG
ncbi:MAG: putative PHD type zinc finger protein with BAH domain-containing protein [Peltula sp. TS41687]|nr:MAG: putative PHD type zinc finger protein with BAH domain-containing protein [Peltula sp. TS41687]